MNGPADRTIKPGKTERVAITLSSRNRYKEFTRKINVFTNDPDHRRDTLTCIGKVLVPFQAKPQHVQFGTLRRDKGPQERTILLTRGDGGPIKPELMPIRHQGVEASLREIEAGERYELEVKIGPPWPNGRIRSGLALKTGVKDAPNMTIPLYAYVVPRLRAKPERLVIPRTAEKAMNRSAMLIWDNGPPGKVLDASVNDPDLSVRVEKRNRAQLVFLDVPEGYSAKSGSRMITIKTDDEQSPTLRVPITFQRSRVAARPTPKPRPGAKAKSPEPRAKGKYSTGARRPALSPAPPNKTGE